eukprot:s2465_g6.t1
MQEYNYISPWTAQTRALLLESSLAFPILAPSFDEIFFEPFTQDHRYPVPVCDLHELGLHRLLSVRPPFFDEDRECGEVAREKKFLTNDATASPVHLSSNPNDTTKLLPVQHRPDDQGDVPNLPDPPVFSDQSDSPRGYELHLVRPEPPIPVTHGTVGIVLIVQHPVVGHSAVLTTTMFDRIEGPQIHEVAHSFEDHMDFEEILHHADALEACHELDRQGLGPCTIQAGRHRFPRTRPLRCHDGLGLVIRVPMALSPEEWEQRVFERLRASDAPATVFQFPDDDEPVAQGDETTLMARSPLVSLQYHNRDGDITPSDHDTDLESSPSLCDSPVVVEEWHLCLVFSLFQEPREVEVPWHDGDELYNRVSRAFAINFEDIDYVHTILHCPADVIQSQRRCLLLQRRQDQPPTSFMRLCLVDVEYKFDHYGPASLIERRVRWLPQRSQRASTIRLIGYEGHCSADSDRCWLWQDDVYISLSADPLEIEHGNYIRLAIPAHPEQAVCETGEYMIPDDLEEHFIFSDDDASSLIQTPIVHWKIDQEDLVQHHTLDQCLENQPVMVFETWYLSSVGWPRCSRSRLVALDEDIDAWPERLRQVWRDRVSPHIHLELAIVHPEVPRAHHGGHIIVFQAVSPDEKAGLLSSYWASRDGALQDRFAQLVDTRLSYPALLQFGDLDLLCANPDYDCHVHIGVHDFDPQDIWPVYHGLHLEIVIDYIPLCRVMSAFSSMEDALDMPSASLAAESTSYDPGTSATGSAVPLPALVSMPSFVQDLHSHWAQVAFSWEDEVGSHDILTWFVDHHDVHLRSCHQPRLVRLSERYEVWEHTIRQAWNDYINEADDIQFFIVFPSPPHFGPDIIAQVLLVRNRQDLFATSVLTVFDTAQERPEPSLQVAITTLQQVALEHVLLGLDLHDRCTLASGDLQCHAWHNQQAFRPTVPLDGFNGISIVLQIGPRRSAQRSPPHAGTTEGPVLLQLAALIQPAVHPERLTTDTVAHGQWPGVHSYPFPAIGERCHDDLPVPADTVLVQAKDTVAEPTAFAV